jgi:lipopolysaccharide transport system permease protein
MLFELTQREIEARYRGSVLGILWSFVVPLLMLAIFTFVFSVVFKARWGQEVTDPSLFALMLFPGMVLHGLLVDVLTRSPTLVVANPNYVKRIVFPLEVLPLVAVGSALFQALVGLVAVALFKLILTGGIPATVLWLPFVVVPFVIFLAGLAWLLSSLGVYVRDLHQMTGVVSTALMFLSPVFYPVDALPQPWRPWIEFNPLTLVLEQTRAVLVFGRAPNLVALGGYSVLACAFAAASLYWFQRTRKGFADVV